MADKFDTYSHGATGDEPSSPLDFASGEAIPPEKFDWFWTKTINAVDNHANLLETIDSDGDGKVDAAEQADQADNATTVKGNDIDSDGDGIVDEADVSDQTRSFVVRNSDPSSFDGGEVWIRSDL